MIVTTDLTHLYDNGMHFNIIHELFSYVGVGTVMSNIVILFENTENKTISFIQFVNHYAVDDYINENPNLKIIYRNDK